MTTPPEVKVSVERSTTLKDGGLVFRVSVTDAGATFDVALSYTLSDESPSFAYVYRTGRLPRDMRTCPLRTRIEDAATAATKGHPTFVSAPRSPRP